MEESQSIKSEQKSRSESEWEADGDDDSDSPDTSEGDKTSSSEAEQCTSAEKEKGITRSSRTRDPIYKLFTLVGLNKAICKKCNEEIKIPKKPLQKLRAHMKTVHPLESETATQVTAKLKDGVYRIVPYPCITTNSAWKRMGLISTQSGEIVNGYAGCYNCLQVYEYIKSASKRMASHRCRGFHRPRESETEAPLPGAVVTVDPNIKQGLLDVISHWVVEDKRPFSVAETDAFANVCRRLFAIGAKYGENVDLDLLLPSEGNISDHLLFVNPS